MENKSLEVGSRFIASTMHEVRTPLQTIISTLELLEETPLSKEQLEYLHQIDFSANSLLGLANDVLDFTKITANNFKLDNNPYDPITLTEHVVDLITIECFSRGIEIITDIDYSIPRNVMGDHSRVQQIILNLAKNAAKFTEHGFIMFRLTRKNNLLVFEVIDSGIGVDEQNKELIFNDFYQVDGGVTRKTPGTGLGLSICKNLVSIMGGKIGVLSNPSGGSNFWFTLPLKISDIGEEENDKIEMLPNKRVLIVDDNKFALKSLYSKLTYFGIKNVSTADSGEDALRQITEAEIEGKPFSVIFIDLIMPRIDGWRTAAEITKRAQKQPLIYLLVPEGHLRQEAKMKLLDCYSGYLYKPVKYDALYSTLQNSVSVTANVIHTEVEKTEVIPSAEQQNQINTILDEHIASGLKVLIAEDQIVNQKLIATFLKKFGATVFVAENGEVAVNQVKAHPDIDVIFMDIFMPIKSGIDATIELRKMNYKGIIIACTANNDSEDFKTYKELGIQDIMVKPFKKDAIKAMLEKWNSFLMIPNAKDIISITIIKDQVSKLWDIDDFMDTTENNTEFAISLMDEYVIQVEELMSSLKSELDKKEEERDYYKIELYAHTLKGSSASVSATRFAELGRKMNDAAKVRNMQELEEARINFAIDFITLKAIIENWKQSV